MPPRTGQRPGVINVSVIETEARKHAMIGIFWPPYDRVAWADLTLSRDEAQEIYSRAYWAEFNRLRFERGEYDLL